ncbi:MAG TPA: HEAT repeat domain-containing protein [Candidatus Acidoferrales bacterium]|nr:HEAT repeat domain-containing protein [Candidatus Acidoferrales bacterium]
MTRKILFALLLAVLGLTAAARPTDYQAQAPATQQTLAPATPGQESTAPAAQSPATPPGPVADLPSAAWAMLTQGAASEKTRDRSDALSALTIVGRNPKAVSLMENALADKDVNVRVLAATSLGSIRARSAIPKLTGAVDDSAPQVSFAAVQALWRMGDRRTREILYEILAGERKTKPGVIKGKMASATAQMHDPKSLALIGINQASGVFLGPFSMGISFIEEYTKNNSAPVQALCAQMLAADDSPDTVQELRDALGDKNWAVRASAARALAQLGRPEAIPQLKDMMANDKERPARFAAAAAIIRLSPPAPKALPPPTPAKPAGPASPQKH